MNSILIMFHLESNAGYAMDSLLPVFVQMAKSLVRGEERIHISFTELSENLNKDRLEGVEQLIAFDPKTKNKTQLAFIEEYIRQHGIDVIFGFDMSVYQPSYRLLRKAGVKKIVAYQGAPMSGLKSRFKLMLKQLEVSLRPATPDHYIFESIAMARTAYEGRGILRKKTSVVYMGVDTAMFKPADKESYYAHEAFGIPPTRKIIYYSGHMEERKGVAVLIKAAIHMYEYYGRRDYHFLILGNRKGEEQRYIEILEKSDAREYVTFGGYRSDVSDILPSCYIGAIASTGWDSFTVSSLEIAACGLPLIVSNLQGLSETIVDGETGIAFAPGNYEVLAGHVVALLDNQSTRDLMGRKARERILQNHTRLMQVERLVNVMQKVAT